MNKYSHAIEAIKSRVLMEDAVYMYSPNPPPKHNRIPCPIHGGENYNLSFKGGLYHCFVCKSGGDVIHFVQHIFDLEFIPAIKKLNTDFNLCIPIDRRLTLREQREAERRYEKIIAERKRKEEEKRAYNELYNALCGEWHRLNQNRIDLAPQTPYEEWDPQYVEALQKIDYQGYLVDAFLDNYTTKEW